MPNADDYTERTLHTIEQRISGIYGAAAEEITQKTAKFYATLEARDIAKRKQMDAGLITGQEYREWLRGQMTVGEQYEAMRDKLAQRITEANELAATYINGRTPEILAENYNYTGYELEQANGDLTFTLFDEYTVRRLILEQPELLPPLDVDIPTDLRWNRGKITDAITSAILQGKSIPEIAKSLQEVTDMNRRAAVRNARTAVTGAQNAGRQASYEHAAKMGIDVRKRWIATKDRRTRDSHAEMDGVTVPYNKPFATPLGSVMMYPGDRNGKPGDVYNCRCTIRTVEKAGIEAEPRQVRVRDPKTGENVLVSEMTYREWERWVRARG